MNGRNGIMPALGAVLPAGGAKDAANYVRSLSGLAHDAAAAARGKTHFQTICAACHGPEGKGNPAVGAPNLTDKTWLYSSSEATIVETIEKGRNSVMPAHKDFLGEQRVHIVAAYVYGLSQASRDAVAQANAVQPAPQIVQTAATAGAPSATAPAASPAVAPAAAPSAAAAQLATAAPAAPPAATDKVGIVKVSAAK